MEKENMKKTSADRERRKKLTNAILMAFVCIMMMSGATYAWFTMSNTAKVTSLKLNVAAEGKLYVGKVLGGTKNSALTKVTWFGDANMEEEDMATVQTLYPCTTEDGKTMKKPVYSSETVVGSVENIDTSNQTEKDMYYLEKTFYLYMDEGDGNTGTNKTYDVCLEKTDTHYTDGTYFKSDVAQSGIACVRISFEANGLGNNANNKQAIKVYEPNSDKSLNSSNKATKAGVTIFNPTYKQNSSGNFLDTSGSQETTTGDSETLFQITGDTETAVVIRVWFEGQDDDCCDEIAMQQIEGQLKFKASKVVATP